MSPLHSYPTLSSSLLSWQWWVYAVSLLLSLAGLYGAISSWRRLHVLNRDSSMQPLRSDSTTMYEGPDLNSTMSNTGWGSWRLRFGQLSQRLLSPSGHLAKSMIVWLRVRGVLPVWTEEEEARNIREQLEKHIPSKDGQ